MLKAHLQFAGYSTLPVRIKAVCHRTVQQRGNDSPMHKAGVALEGIAAVECRLDAPVGQPCKIKAHAKIVLGTTNEAIRVGLV
jgi:hypothetical protein